ncbi:unnamed protein product [Schistosoma turkestanicum]|nr:unnamed protein product [Schistosoma turkestanicum]
MNIDNCDSTGPSPLAMLARTCQNIGNIMDGSVASGRFLSPMSNAIRSKQTTGYSIPVTNGGKILNNANNSHNNNNSNNNNNTNCITKLTKSKAMNLNEIIPSSFNKRNITSKYLASNDTSKMNYANSVGAAAVAAAGAGDIDQISSAFNTTTRHTTTTTTTNNIGNNNNDSVVSSLTFNPNYPLRQASPQSNLFSPINSVKTESNSSMVNNHFLKSTDLQQQTTSNALAQLARLSSSFSLPETPKLNFTNLKHANNVTEHRNAWNDIRNTTNNTTNNTTANNNNNNSNNHIHHDSNSFKRVKRRANSNSKYSNTSSDEYSSPPLAKISIKDNNYSFLMNSTNNHNYTTNRDSNCFPHYNELNTSSNNNNNSNNNHNNNINISPNMTANHRTQSPNFNYYNEQLFGNKEEDTVNIMMNSKDTQEKFSYQLARSFLDFFYGKLANSMNSELNICSNAPPPTTNTNTTTNTTTSTINTTNNNNSNNNNDNNTFKENHHESIHPSCLTSDRRTLEWLVNTNLMHRPPTNEHINPTTTNHTQSVSTTSPNTFPCLLCGQIFHGHTELCMHVYTHLLSFNLHESGKKPTQMEDALRFLQYETNAAQNHYRSSNGLLTEPKLDNSFMPFFLPPPSQLPRSGLTATTTTIPASLTTTNTTTTTHMPTLNNYNNFSSRPITDINHPTAPSESMYLFQSYLSQWLRSFSSPHSNYQLNNNDTINHNPLPNSSWLSSDMLTMHKSTDYKNWQNVLTAAYLYSLKESTNTGTVGPLPWSTTPHPAALSSIPLQNPMHRNENSNYYDMFLAQSLS